MSSARRLRRLIEFLWFIWPAAGVLAAAPRHLGLAVVLEVVWLVSVFIIWIVNLVQAPARAADVDEEFVSRSATPFEEES